MGKMTFDFGLKDFEFRNSMIDFIIQNFKIENIKYDNNDEMGLVLKKDENIKHKEFINIDFHLKESEIVSLQNHNNSHSRIYGYDLTILTTNCIVEHVRLNYSEKVVYGNIVTIMDSKFQNTDEVKRWTRRNLQIPTYVQIIPNPNYIEGAPGMDMITKEFISIESLPGHSHQMSYDEKLWFGSCWQMYFSPVYYKYIPKVLFDSFEDCYENKVLENGLRKITLYEGIMDYDLPENRANQWAFRRKLGIDSIAHELTKSNNRKEPENLPVLITKQNCTFGQTKVTRFLDENNRLISSDKAIKREVKEYLEDGITVVFEETSYL